MYYNWEEIFKDKSNRELYDIFVGNSNLPESTIPFAKRELENRNFDFENMEANKVAWKLSSIIQEEDYFGSQVKKITYIPIKFYLLGVLSIIIIFFFLVPKTHDSIYIGFPMFLTFGTLFYFSNNYSFKKQQKEIKKRSKEKLELIKKLEKEELLKEESPIAQDIERERQKNSRILEIMVYVTIGLALILWIIRRMKNYP